MRQDKAGAPGAARKADSHRADASSGNGFLGGGRYDGLLLAILAFAVYLTTMSRAMVPEDFGELATTATTLGIAHPTGYPLLTLMGRVVTALPLGGVEPFFRLNVFSALLCAVALVFFHRLFALLLAPLARAASARLAAAAATLTLAFTPVFWTQSAYFEVYALHLAMTSIVLVLFLRALEAKAHPRLWLLFAYALGLSFSNHMMTVLLAPACLYLFFSVSGFGAVAWRRIAFAVLPFLAGLTPYLYLLIRSAGGPLMNWGEPTTLARLWRHVDAQQYQHRMFVSAADAWDKVSAFFAALPANFAYLPLLVAVYGLVRILPRDRRPVIFALLIFLACVFFVGFYDFFDTNFELNGHVAVAIAVAFGVAVIADRLASGAASGDRATLRPAVAALLLLPFLLPLALNYRKADLSRDFITEDYSVNVLQSVGKDAIIFTRQGSLFTSPAFYLQIVRGVRPDVAIVDDMLGSPWYVAHLEKAHPGVFSAARPELEALLRETGKAETLGTFDQETALLRFGDFVRALVLRGNRPVYITYEIETNFGFRRTPEGMVYRLVDRDGPLPTPAFRDFSFRPIPKGRLFTDMVTGYYASSYVNQGIQAAVVHGDSALGLAFMRKAMAVDPTFEPARNWMTRLAPR
jgi:hypothetical protein